MSSTTLTSTKTWFWQGLPISYQMQGNKGPAVILVHGFGASWGHWRKNIPVLAETCQVYAIDLIGFGASAKPQPNEKITYTLETWGKQIVDFCQQVVGSPAFFVGNSIGCIVAMQAVVISPDIALSIALINCSLRLLHDRKRQNLPWIRRVGTPLLQKFLSVKSIGNFFFSQLARPKTVKRILLQAYNVKEAVTDELIDILMKPARDPGAAAVFLALTNIS